jgi:hypothetical protein
MKKSYYIIGVTLLVLVIGGLFLLNTTLAPSPAPEAPALVNPDEEQTGLVTTFVDFGDGRLEEYEYQVTGESTAYEALINTGLEIATKEFSFGVLVDGIDDLQGGTDGKYWIFYVNSIPAKVSADNLVVSPGDEIIWIFETEDSKREL